MSSEKRGSSLAGSARRAVLRLGWDLQDRLLTREQRRGVLGAAHRRWRPPANYRQYWSAYDWSRGGNEWNASPEWKQALIEHVLERWIPPGAAVLEIGAGAGRWSEPLRERASRLVLVDASERPLELCRERFGADQRVEYVLSSGSDLPGVGDASIDAVWSFDVFVHLTPRTQAAYLGEIGRVLKPGGLAVIHHSDGRNRGQVPSRAGWRAPMSRNLFAKLAVAHGLAIERQFDSWGPERSHDLGAFGDAITVCGRRADSPPEPRT